MKPAKFSAFAESDKNENEKNSYLEYNKQSVIESHWKECESRKMYCRDPIISICLPGRIGFKYLDRIHGCKCILLFPSNRFLFLSFFQDILRLWLKFFSIALYRR